MAPFVDENVGTELYNTSKELAWNLTRHRRHEHGRIILRRREPTTGKVRLFLSFARVASSRMSNAESLLDMIHIVVGTKAQLIKMAPVMVALRNLGLPYNYISTGQHRETMDDILQNFDLPRARVKIYDGPDVVSIGQMIRWTVFVLWKSLTRRKEIFLDDNRGIVLVHGDTFSTLLGAFMGKLAGLEVGHVESGLRSFKLWQPFPEEITRLLTFRLTDHYFCPNQWAVDNLRSHHGKKISTGGNTLYDSLHKALAKDKPAALLLPLLPFGVVTLHRFENFKDRASALRIVENVERLAAHRPLLFVLHKTTEFNLRRFGLFERIATCPSIELRPRYDYFSFIKILQAAEFVVSDGGSNQEECYYMGKPVLLFRNVSERKEGVGENVVVSEFNTKKIDAFIRDPAQFVRSEIIFPQSPSFVIAQYCKEWAA